MKRKRIFTLSWYPILLFILLIAAIIGAWIWLLVDVIDSISADEVIELNVFVYVVMPICILFVLAGLGASIFWIKVDGYSIVARNVFKVIRKVAISDIIEIKRVKLSVNKAMPLYPRSYYYVLIDSQDGKVCLFTYMTRKGEFIKIKGSKRSKQLLDGLLPDIKVSDMTDEDIAEYKRIGMYRYR